MAARTRRLSVLLVATLLAVVQPCVGSPTSLELRQLQTAADTHTVPENTYVETFEKPRIDSTLNSFMREPGMLLELSRPAFELGAIGANDACGVSESEELRQWLFTQAIGVSTRPGGSAITMLYAGMEDGRFLGCTHRRLSTSPSSRQPPHRSQAL